MLDTFLIKTLRIIASDDLKIIQQFMGVNFFNGGPRKLKCIKLLTCLIHLKPSYDDAKRLHRSYVCRTTGIKDEGELTKVAAELLSVIRKSLLHIRYNRLPDTQHHLDMARVFNEAQHTQFFEQSIEKAKQANHKQAYQDTDFNLIDWQLKEEVIIHNSRFVTLKNPISMSGVIDSLDRLYIHKNLLYESALLARSAFSTNDNPSSNKRLNALIALAEPYIETDGLTRILVNFIKISTRPHIVPCVEFEAFIQESVQESGTIAPSTLAGLHSYLRSYASIAYNKGHSEYLSVLVKLFQHHIQSQSIYDTDQKIHAITLQTAIMVALRAGQYQWADDILEQHRYRISGVNTEQVYAYNKANCLFYLRRYDQALEQLPDNFHDAQTDINAKRLRIKIYHETGSPLLSYVLDTFGVNDIFRSQKRGKVPAVFIEVNSNFLKIMRSIVALPPRPAAADLADLNERIQEAQLLAEREWLQEILLTLQK